MKLRNKSLDCTANEIGRAISDKRPRNFQTRRSLLRSVPGGRSVVIFTLHIVILGEPRLCRRTR